MPNNNPDRPSGYPWSWLGFISDRYFEIIDCGDLKPRGGSEIARKNGRLDYQLIYIIKGRCYLKIDGKDVVAEEGEVILFRPHEPQFYYYKEKDASHDYWVHFSGTECERIFEENNLQNQHIIKLTNTSEVEHQLSKLCFHFHLGGPHRDSICNGLMISVLGLVGHYNAERENSVANITDNKNQQLVREVLSWFRHSKVMNYSITDCAKFCNMSEAHFSRIFKDIMGVSPQQYMTNAKLERAKQLLYYTSDSIADIASDVGYDDPNYFSRIFKKHMKVTPKQYRDGITKK